MVRKIKKRLPKDSEKHRVYKKIAKRYLKEFFGVRQEDIFEEFPIGEHIFDVIAYPRRSRKNAAKLSIITLECGNLNAKGDCIRCLRKISDMLDFVDIVIWMPYSIHHNPFADILMSQSFQELYNEGKIKFSTESLDLHKVPMNLRILKSERKFHNAHDGTDFLGALAFFKGETYQILKKRGQKFLQD